MGGTHWLLMNIQKGNGIIRVERSSFVVILSVPLRRIASFHIVCCCCCCCCYVRAGIARVNDRCFGRELLEQQTGFSLLSLQVRINMDVSIVGLFFVGKEIKMEC